MNVLLAALVVLFVSGFLAMAAGRFPLLTKVLGAGGTVAGCALGLVAGLARRDPRVDRVARACLGCPLRVVLGCARSFVGVVCLADLRDLRLERDLRCAVSRAHRERKSLGAHWFFFNLLVASMLMVVTARNGILFLIAWEVMSLASYFLVIFDDEDESVLEAGRTYLIATHLGTAFLLGFFIVLGSAGRFARLRRDRRRRAAGRGDRWVAVPARPGWFRNQGRVDAVTRLAP